MTRRNRGVVVLAVQVVLVLSIAGKYVYERKVCPRVWVGTAQIDPNLPFRGRYLALRLVVDACALPHVEGRYIRIDRGPMSEMWNWRVKPEAKDGRLVVTAAGDDVRPELSQG